MGYYIETGTTHGKAKTIAEQFNGEILPHAPKKYSDIPADKAVIAVVDNGPFEAAGFCFSENEFEVFTDPLDPRPIKYVMIGREDAEKETGFKPQEARDRRRL